jgi:2-polyprenyl-6-methoxyphenol hydroxylase-like FAD-dependent oxidoreductase
MNTNANRSNVARRGSARTLIVGAGPVGLTMAMELARYGISVRIIDKAAARTDKSKALVLWSRTLEMFDRAACAEMFIATGRKVDAANIIAGGKVLGRVSLGGVNSPYPYALMLPQSDTERLLEEHLGSIGVTVEREVELTSFTTDPSGVTAVLRHADGREETMQSEWLIGCDGAHSTVRHTLGLEFEGETLQSSWILADIHVSGYPFPESELAIYWHEDGVLVFFPISPGRFRVIADTGASVDAPTLEQVQGIIDRRGPAGLTASDAIWLSAFRINERKVAAYRSGRAFIAGDASHVHSPAGGQGMNTGMQDAFNLAWKLVLVCRGTCSEKLLDSYSAERSAVGQQVLEAAGRLTAVAVMRNHTAQAVRNLVARVVLGLSPVRRAMVETMTEVSIGYQKSPLNGPGAHVAGPAPGARMPPRPDAAPPGSGSAPRFALFAKSNDETRRIIEKFSELLEPEVRSPLHEEGMWLVRPDGYTACVAKSDDAKAIEAYLNALA